jgi:hypothetical protein
LREHDGRRSEATAGVEKFALSETAQRELLCNLAPKHLGDFPMFSGILLGKVTGRNRPVRCM